MNKKTNLCLGVDPHILDLPPFFETYKKEHGVIKFVKDWVLALLDAASSQVPAVKFQSSFFESLGHEGFSLLPLLVKEASSKGMLTILDVKRCDIASTMRAYAYSAFEQIKADAMTTIPYMGMDVFTPLYPWLEKGHGVYSVFLSSNPSGHRRQATTLNEKGVSLAQYLHQDLFEELEKKKISGSLGLVVGVSSYYAYQESLEELSRKYSFLMPGLGAQGGSVTSSLKGLLSSSSPHLFPVSRSLSGLGDKTSKNHLLEIRNFDDYKYFVKEKISFFKDSFSSI